MVEEIELCFICNRVPVEKAFDICDVCWNTNPHTKYLFEDEENDN